MYVGMHFVCFYLIGEQLDKYSVLMTLSVRCYIYLYKVVIYLWMFGCLIITHEPLDQFAFILNGEFDRTREMFLNLVLKF